MEKRTKQMLIGGLIVVAALVALFVFMKLRGGPCGGAANSSCFGPQARFDPKDQPAK